MNTRETKTDSNSVSCRVKGIIGYVTSDKMDKTITVEIRRRKKHEVYGKIITITKKVKAHDEMNECRVGDKVQLVETRPLSKDKRWRLYSIVSKAEQR